MRVEVLVGSDDPIIFPLKTSKIVIGSGESCDLTLDASGVSRKHIVILTEGDQFFVIDQGSTNGSFLNEERLVPGKKTEFTSFFPVRLGDNVLISLLSDEEDVDYSIPVPREKTSPGMAVPKERSDSTTVIKLNDLKNVSTEKLVLQRNTKREKLKKTAPSKPQQKKSKIGFVPAACILLVLFAGYYNLFLKNPPEESQAVSEIGRVIEVEKIEAPEIKSSKIPDTELPKKDSFASLLNELKCVTDLEKKLCHSIPGANFGLWGVTQVGLTYKAAIDGNKYYEEAKKFVKFPSDSSEASLNKYESLLRKTAALVFLTRDLPVLDPEFGDDNKLAIGFFIQTESESQLRFVLAFFPKVFNNAKPELKEAHLHFIKNNPESSFTVFDQYFTIY